jgi:hypothetical protein
MNLPRLSRATKYTAYKAMQTEVDPASGLMDHGLTTVTTVVSSTATICIAVVDCTLVTSSGELEDHTMTVAAATWTGWCNE